MEPTIPTSFIPKSSMPGSGRPQVDLPKVTLPPKTVGILTFITVIIAISAALSFVGVYLYEQRLGSQKQNLEQSITDARSDLGSDFVAEMQRFEQRISGVRQLLQSHIVVSPIFEELQTRTLRSVQFKQFKYNVGGADQGGKSTVQVTLTGVARSYSIIALQSDTLAQSTFIKNPVFSNLTLDDQTKSINFSLAFTVDTADLSYQKFIEKRNLPAQQTMPVSVNQDIM